MNSAINLQEHKLMRGKILGSNICESTLQDAYWAHLVRDFADERFGTDLFDRCEIMSDIPASYPFVDDHILKSCKRDEASSYEQRQ